MLDFAIGLAREVGRFILEHTHRIVHRTQGSKRCVFAGGHSHAAPGGGTHRAQAFPRHGILAEEGFRRQGTGDLLWLVDPLDGTTNYVHGLPIVLRFSSAYAGR